MEIAPVVTIAKVVKEDDEANKADKEPSQPSSQQPGIKIKDFARMPEAPQPPQGDAAAAALGARRKPSTSANRLGQVQI